MATFPCNLVDRIDGRPCIMMMISFPFLLFQLGLAVAQMMTVPFLVFFPFLILTFDLEIDGLLLLFFDLCTLIQVSFIVKRDKYCPDWPEVKKHDEADERKSAKNDEHGRPAQRGNDCVVENDAENCREAEAREKKRIDFDAKVGSIDLPGERREYRLLSTLAGPRDADPDRVKHRVLDYVGHAEGQP